MCVCARARVCNGRAHQDQHCTTTIVSRPPAHLQVGRPSTCSSESARIIISLFFIFGIILPIFFHFCSPVTYCFPTAASNVDHQAEKIIDSTAIETACCCSLTVQPPTFERASQENCFHVFSPHFKLSFQIVDIGHRFSSKVSHQTWCVSLFFVEKSSNRLSAKVKSVSPLERIALARSSAET